MTGKRKITDDAELFFNHNIDLATKTYYLGSDVYSDEGGDTGVDHVLAANAIKGLHVLDNLTGDKPITILLNSPGGDIINGMAIYDAIKACQHEVIIKVFGYAMSMGSILLQAGDRRLLSPNCKVMIHYGYEGHAWDHPKTVQKWAEEGKRLTKTMEEIYLTKLRERHPDFSKKSLAKLLDFDTILSAQEAVDLGLADEVLKG